MPAHIHEISVPEGYPFDDYRSFPGLSPLIDEVEDRGKYLRRRLRRRKIWMLNSTATGGGVAEMMPTLISLFHRLRLPVSWLVMEPEDPAFFILTKKLHHMLHGRGDGGKTLSKQDRSLYALDSRKMADELEGYVKPGDILIVHDPQPLGAGHILNNRFPDIQAIWRCHIGTEFKNSLTHVAWGFLRKYLSTYKECIFTHPDYIPRFLKKKSSILYPAIDPLSDKNVWLSTEEHVDILRMAGLYGKRIRGFQKPVRQLRSDGRAVAPLDFRPFDKPIILQISRWDHLKGFIPLIKGFLYMKRKVKETQYRGLRDLTRRMIRDSILVLAGPEVGTVADDPEPAIVLEEILTYYKSLSSEDQKHIHLFLLPMESKRENALIVNALQRTAEVIVQNSIREGFGLTVTEALWKEVPTLATKVGGIRLQIKDNETGILVKDPLNAREVGKKLLYLLTHKREKMAMTRRAWLEAIESFLVPGQLSKYLQLFEQYL